MGPRRETGRYGDDDDDADEKQRLLQTIPPGGVRTRGIHGSASGILEAPEVYKSRWWSIRVMYLTMFLSSVSFSICMSSLYPYLKVLDRSATTDFLGWVVAAYSVGQLVASPFFGAWSNCRHKSREPIIVSLTINVLANILYMYLESISHHKSAFLVVARAFVGFGAGNVAVVRSYVSGATTLEERTPAMANMSACQAVGFIIGPVIQTAMVPIGYPGPIHSAGFHLDLYTATALLSALVGIINIILLIVVFKEHRVPDDDLIPDIQGSGADTSPDLTDTPLDYLAVISSITLFFSILFIFSVFETISTPLSMHMFAWSKSKATLLIGVMLGCAGVVSIVVFVFIKILSKRFNERYLLFGGFLICLVGFIIYLPWGSHYPEIQYADFSPAMFSPTKPSSLSTGHAYITSEISFSVQSTSVKSTSVNPLEFNLYADAQKDISNRKKYLLNERYFSKRLNSTLTTIEILTDTTASSSFGTTQYTQTSQPISKQSMQTTNSNSETTDSGITTSQYVTTQSSYRTTSEYTTNHEISTTHKITETTESSRVTSTETTQTTVQESTTSKQTTSQESTTKPSQSTSLQSTTGQVTTEDVTTEQNPNITTPGPPTENTTSEAVGCPYYYHWCFTTPSILLWQFLLGTLFVAVGYPTCNVMAYAIYSKILGPKPQGVWMGWLTAAGSLARCLGPVFVSQVYDAYGPRVTFISMCVLIVITVLGFLIVCRRLVPFRALTITV